MPSRPPFIAPVAALTTRLFPAPPSAAQEDAQPDPRLRGEPWTVDLMPSIRGSITLIGYDRLGDVMAELRIPKRCYKPGMAARLERWIRENDDTPPNLTVL